MGFEKGLLTTERFTLITKRDDQGKLQHELQDYKERTFQSYNQFNDVWSDLYPYGAVILEDEGPQATCVGILNFTKEDEDWLISPVFFTPETLTGKVQLYYPTDVKVKEEAVSGCPDGGMEPTTSQIDSAIHSQDVPSSTTAPSQTPGLIVTDSAIHSQDVPSSTTAPSQTPGLIVTGYGNHPPKFSVEPGNQGGASLTNEDQAVYPDDYTLQGWQKLYEKVRDENTKLKQQSERNQKEISDLKEDLKELRMDIKRTEQRDRKETSDLKEDLKELRMDIKRTEQQNEVLRAENNNLRTKLKDKSESWDAERKELLVERKELLVENKKLREDWDAERKYWRKENKELRAENNELRKDWNAESEELLAELKESRAVNKALTTEHKELITAYEELYARHKEVPDQLGDLLSQPNSPLFGDDTSRIKGSNDAKAEGPSGTSANSPQEESDSSRKKDETFLDPKSEDVSKLE